MKKLVAILMALILSLSVAASLAEIVNPLSPLIDVNRLEGRFVLASVRSAGNGRRPCKPHPKQDRREGDTAARRAFR